MFGLRWHSREKWQLNLFVTTASRSNVVLKSPVQRTSTHHFLWWNGSWSNWVAQTQHRSSHSDCFNSLSGSTILGDSARFCDRKVYSHRGRETIETIFPWFQPFGDRDSTCWENSRVSWCCSPSYAERSALLRAFPDFYCTSDPQCSSSTNPLIHCIIVASCQSWRKSKDAMCLGEKCIDQSIGGED